MNLTKKLSTLFLTTILSAGYLPALAQTKYIVELGATDSVYSEILEESREYYVHLPESFDPESEHLYPVLYVLDGDYIMDAVSTVYKYYWGGFMPEMIIIGIANLENRKRDLTTSDLAYEQGVRFNGEQGGAEQFTAFLEKELLPHIENKYPVSSFRSLIGHSYGGLFTINAFLNHRDLFANYLAIDPSLDWDQQALLKKAQKLLPASDFTGKSLFISLGGQLNMQDEKVTIDNVMSDTTENTLSARSKIEFSKAAEAARENGLRFQWKYYPDDLHLTVVLPSIMDGLISLFSWFQMEQTYRFNDPDTPAEELMEIVRAREKKLTENFGYFVAPYDEELLNILGYMNLDMGLVERSRAFFLLCIEYYPLSANAYDSMADFYISQEDHEKALEYASFAYELSGSEIHRQKVEELRNK